MKRENGFGVVEVLLILVVVGVLGAVGYVAYNNFATKNAEQTQVADDKTMNHDVKAPEISSTKDLDTAASSVDDSAFENDGTDKLNSDTSGF